MCVFFFPIFVYIIQFCMCVLMRSLFGTSVLIISFFPPMFTLDSSWSVSYKSGTWAASRCKLTAQLIRLPSLWLKPESSSIRRHFNGVNHLAEKSWFFLFFLNVCLESRRCVCVDVCVSVVWLSEAQKWSLYGFGFFILGFFEGAETGIIVFMMVKGFSYFLLVW